MIQTIGYTADGRMASFSPGVQAPGGQYITSLSYNQDAQLSAFNAGGTALASYTYDAFGQRLLKTFSGTSGEIYQYGQNGMLLEETDQSGAAQADYIYLNGRPIADLAPSTGTLYFLHDDMLGTPQLATDSNQTTQWQATYAPFGKTSSVSGTVTQNLRLPGQYFDSESGWNHNGFRDYIPGLGRYAEPDPLAMLGTARFYGPNLGGLINQAPQSPMGDSSSYTYAANSPMNFLDPSGMKIGVIGDYADYLTAITYLESSPLAASIIQQLTDSSTVYMIYANDAGRGGDQIEPGQPTKADWLPHDALCVKHGMQSPALQLMHELIHLLQHQQGRPRFVTGSNGVMYDNWEEADNQIVNSIARQLGELTRESYSDAGREPESFPIPTGEKQCGCKEK